MSEPLPEVWTTRDYPVLREIARRIDVQAEGGGIPLTGLADAAGVSESDLQLAVRALERRHLLQTMGVASGRVLRVKNLSGDAYVLTGLHPRGEDAVDRLVDALMQAAEQSSEPEQRTKLRRAAEALGDVTKSVTSGVVTAIVSGALSG